MGCSSEKSTSAVGVAKAMFFSLHYLGRLKVFVEGKWVVKVKVNTANIYAIMRRLLEIGMTRV